MFKNGFYNKIGIFQVERSAHLNDQPPYGFSWVACIFAVDRGGSWIASIAHMLTNSQRSAILSDHDHMGKSLVPLCAWTDCGLPVAKL